MCQSCEFTFADPTNFDFSVHPQPQCYHPQYPYLHAQQTFIQPQQYQLQPQHLFFDSQTANNYAYVSHLQSLAPGTYPIGQVAPTNNIFAQQTSHPFPLQQSSRQSLYSQGHLNLTHKSHTSYYPMAQSSEDFDRSAYQADDQTYEHNFTDELVSNKLPSTLIVDEYASADHMFVTKTRQIPHIFPTWRRVRGDGSCGFRSAAFGYCEALLSWRDAAKIRSELQRVTGLTELITVHIGDDPGWYFDDCVVPLYQELEAWVHLEPTAAQELLLRWFQDTEKSVYVLWFVRALTYAHMRSESAHFENYIPEPLQIYTERMLQADAEIDHVGFSSLSAAFLQPAGIRLEIHQLNRDSHSTTLDCEAFEPALEQALYTVRTLYRPGHYDLIYCPEPRDVPSSTIVHWTQLPQETPPSQTPDFGSYDLERMWHFRDRDQAPSFPDVAPFDTAGSHGESQSPALDRATLDMPNRSNISITLSVRPNNDPGSGSDGSGKDNARRTRSSRKVPVSKSTRCSPPVSSHHLRRRNPIPQATANIHTELNPSCHLSDDFEPVNIIPKDYEDNDGTLPTSPGDGLSGGSQGSSVLSRASLKYNAKKHAHENELHSLFDLCLDVSGGRCNQDFRHASPQRARPGRQRSHLMSCEPRTTRRPRTSNQRR